MLLVCEVSDEMQFWHKRASSSKESCAMYSQRLASWKHELGWIDMHSQESGVRIGGFPAAWLKVRMTHSLMPSCSGFIVFRSHSKIEPIAKWQAGRVILNMSGPLTEGTESRTTKTGEKAHWHRSRKTWSQHWRNVLILWIGKRP